MAEEEAAKVIRVAEKEAELERTRIALMRQGQINAANAFKANIKGLAHGSALTPDVVSLTQTNCTHDGSNGVKFSGTVRDVTQLSTFWNVVGISIFAAAEYFCGADAAACSSL